MSTLPWDRLQSLFDVAVSLPPAERDAYLSSECGPDTALRQQIESLIAASAHASAALGGAVSEAARGLTAAAAPGQRVGPWELIREIGHGGMGAVFLAHRADGEYQAQVAIKLIGGVRTAEHLRRFRIERQILAGLEHPNIAHLVGGGSTDEGVPWVAMELVDGVPIDRYCDEHDLGVPARLRLFLDVCEAVAYAHRNLVVHRDIKPGNILVTAQGAPKLLDFGIAKLLDPAAADPHETGTAMRLLTPAFASPEQLRAQPVTIASDVYALGVVLYRLLAGVMPYDVTGRSLLEIERLVCETDPPRPSAATESARLRRALRGDLDTIVMTALQKDPSRRYETVERFADDLRRHLGGLPVRARGDDWAYRARKFTVRHRWGVGVAAAAVLLLGGFTSTLSVQNQRLEQERDAATSARASAEQVSAFLAGIFRVSDPALARGDTVTARQLLDRGARRVEEELRDQPAVQAGMMRLIGEVYRGLGLQSDARPLLERALAQHRALHGEEHLEVATSKLALAGSLQDLGDVDAAEPLYRDALATRIRLLGPEHPDVAEAYSQLAYLLESNGDIEEAERMFRIALAQDRRFFAADDPRVASALVKLGRLLRAHDGIDEAEPMLREALGILHTTHGEDHPDVADAMRNLAALLRDKGEYAEADSLYRLTIEIRRRVLGERHPELAITINSYALLLDRMGETERAAAAFREFLALAEANHEGPHPDLAAGHHNLASALRDLGQYDQALEHFRRSIAIGEQVLDADHPNLAHPRMGVASVLIAQGLWAEAVPWLREALALRQALPRDHRYRAETLGDLGEALTQLGRYAEAEPHLGEAYRIQQLIRDPGDRRLIRARERLVELYRRTGRTELAATLERESAASAAASGT